MSEHDPMSAMPASALPEGRSRRKGAYIAAALVLSVAAIGAFAGSSFSQGLRHGLVNVPETTATAASFEGRFGDFGPGWASVLPNGVIEAFACARPVVALDAGGLKDAVRSGETGILVPPGDAGALGRAIDHLLGDDALRSRCGQQALAWAERECSAELEATRFEALYAELVGRSRDDRGHAAP